jgi:hypothetical protein
MPAVELLGLPFAAGGKVRRVCSAKESRQRPHSEWEGKREIVLLQLNTALQVRLMLYLCSPKSLPVVRLIK